MFFFCLAIFQLSLTLISLTFTFNDNPSIKKQVDIILIDLASSLILFVAHHTRIFSDRLSHVHDSATIHATNFSCR